MAESSSAQSLQGLDSVTKRLLEAREAHQCERAANAQSVEAHSPEAGSLEQVPSAKWVAELSEATLEAGPTLLELSEQAQRSQVSGEVFRCVDVLERRLRAIEWFTSQFTAFGYRDEWLAEAVNYMDRVAVAGCTGTSSGSSSDPLQEDTCEMAKQVMASRELWLAAVLVALKMCEAESELDSSAESLVIPLVSFGQAGYKRDRSRWNQILAAEMRLCHKLNFCLVVPNALQLVDRLAHDVCRVARVDTRWQLSRMADEALDRACWAGLEEGHLPLLKGPPLKNKEEEEKRKNAAMPLRRLTHFQALARFLGELTVVHKPRDAYGEENHPCMLAIAVVHLALHSFKGAGPPEACIAELAKIQAQVLTDVKVTEEVLPDLLASIYRLWSSLPQSSPVLKKWRAREELLGGALPSAPSKAQLPTELQKSCCAFSTPQRKRQKVEMRGTSATPCGKQPPPSAGRPSSLEPRCPGSGGSAAAEADSQRPDDSPLAEALPSSNAEEAPKTCTKPLQPATCDAPIDIAAAAVLALPMCSGGSPPQPDSPSSNGQCHAEAMEVVAAPSPSQQPAVSLPSSMDATPSASSSVSVAAAVTVENTSPCSEASSQTSSKRTTPVGQAMHGFGNPRVCAKSLLKRQPTSSQPHCEEIEIVDDPEEASTRPCAAMDPTVTNTEQPHSLEQQPPQPQDDESPPKIRRRKKRPSLERVDSAPLEHRREEQLETQQSEPSQESQQLQPHQPLADEAATRPCAAMHPAATNTACGEQPHSLEQQPLQPQDYERRPKLKRLKRPSAPEDPVEQRDEQLHTQQSEPLHEIPQQQPSQLISYEGTSPEQQRPEQQLQEQQQQQPPQPERGNQTRRLRLTSSSRQEVASSPDDVVDVGCASPERERRDPLLPVHARAASEAADSPELQSTPEQDQRLQNTGTTVEPAQQLQNTSELDQQPRSQGHPILLPVQEVHEEDGEEEAPREEDEDEAMSCNPSQNSVVSRDSYNMSEECNQAVEIPETKSEQEEQGEGGEENDKDEREKQAREDMVEVDEEEKVKRGSEDEREESPNEETSCEVVEDDAAEFAKGEGEMQLQQPQERQLRQEQQCLPPIPTPEVTCREPLLPNPQQPESQRPPWQPAPWQLPWQNQEQRQQQRWQKPQQCHSQPQLQQQQQQRQLQPQQGQLPASSVVHFTGGERVAEPITEPEITKQPGKRAPPPKELREHSRSPHASQMWLKVFHHEWGCGKCRWTVCTPSCWKARTEATTDMAELRRKRAVLGKMARRQRCLAPKIPSSRPAQAPAAVAAMRKLKRKFQKIQKINFKKSYELRDSASRSRPRPIATPSSARAVVPYNTAVAPPSHSVVSAGARPQAISAVAKLQLTTAVAQPQPTTIAQPQAIDAAAQSQATLAVAQPQSIAAVAQQVPRQLQLPPAAALVPRATAGQPPPMATAAGIPSRRQRPPMHPFGVLQRKKYSQRQRKPIEQDNNSLALHDWDSPDKKDLARCMQLDKRHSTGPVRASAARSSISRSRSSLGSLTLRRSARVVR